MQYAVRAVCKSAGVPYNWDKSTKLAEPQHRHYIDPVNIEDKVASQAIADMLGPVGLLYGVDANGVYLYKPEKAAEIKSNLKVLDVNFEPIHQGKNIVWITVENKADKSEFFGVNVYSRSVDYGPQGVGWGTSLYEKFNAGQTKKLRYVYKIQGPVTENTYIRLSFYNATSLKHNENKDLKPFAVRLYKSSDLDLFRMDDVEFEPVQGKERQAVLQIFRKIQRYIRNKKYEEAWQLFSDDYKKSEYQSRGLERFKQQMEPKHPLHSAFNWEKDDFVKLEPRPFVINRSGVVIFDAEYEGESWSICFVMQDGQWKIDDIVGYRPRILDMQEADNK